MKNKFNYLLMGALVCSFGFMASCSSSDDSSDNGGGGNATPSNIVPTTPINPANMKMSALSGFVFDTNGKGIAGVTVTSGTATAKTDIDGGFVFSSINAVGDRTVVRFSKAGYMDVVRSAAKQDGDVWEVVMAKKSDSSTSSISTESTFYMQDGSEMEVDGMKVELKGGGFVKDGTENAPVGPITADMVYLDPDNKDFSDLMPGGDLAAEQKNEETGATESVQLVSYGMTAVNMTDSEGDKVQLNGKTATVTFPIPESMADDPRVKNHEDIPLWSFDEEKGLWVREGMAHYDSDLDAYVGEVTHFSWANLDWPEARATVKVTVTDAAGNALSHVKVTIGQVTKSTDKNGKTETYVPINTAFTITVLSEDYSNYTDIQKVDISDNELSAGDVKEVTIQLPTLAHLSGTIVNEGEGNKIATVWVEYNGKSTKKVHSDINGQFYMNAPADYTGPATLKVRSADGTEYSQDITLTGKDQAFRLVIKSDVSAGGGIKVTMKDGSGVHNFAISDFNIDDFEGIGIINNTLCVCMDFEKKHHSSFENEDGYDMLNIYIENYSASTTEYTCSTEENGKSNGVNFNLYHNGSDYYDISLQSGTIKVTKKGNAYRFQITGEAKYYDNSTTGGNLANADIEADFTLSYLLTAVYKHSVSSSDFPSNTPLLTSKTDPSFAAVVTNSNVLGKGGLIWYGNKDITFEDFKALKAKADASFGTMLEGSNYDESETSEAQCNYFKNNQYLSICWSPWNEATTYEDTYFNFDYVIYPRWGYGRITILSMDNMKFPHTVFSEAMRVKSDRSNMPWQTRK